MPLSITNISASGDFAQTNGCPSSLDPNTSCTIDVIFTPSATGNRTGGVNIIDNAAGSPHSVTLTGTGFVPLVPLVDLSATTLTFGNQAIGTTSAAQAVTLTNSGTATLNISSLTASGDFSQTNNCGSSVTAGSSCLINVSFQPTQTGSRAGAITITDNSSGSPHGVALTGTGFTAATFSWGDNDSGQLGNGTINNASTAVRVTGSPGVKAIDSSPSHTVSLRSDGTVWSWGFNASGQLGNGNTTSSTVAVQSIGLTGVIAVAAGGDFSLALKSDGTLWAWGNNASGQLGNGGMKNSSTPVQVGGLTGLVAIAAGGGHSLAVKSDGSIWAWGLNNVGQLGNGTSKNAKVPVQLSSLTGINGIAAGDAFSLALKSDGTVWAWGFNGSGGLGNGTTTNSSTPVQVTGLSEVAAVSAGQSHSLALKSDGTIWGCGLNNRGQLGNGTFTNTTLPVLVSGLSSMSGIAAGRFHSLGLKADGSLWAWGYNEVGQLGDGTVADRNLPVQALGIRGAGLIGSGLGHQSFAVCIPAATTLSPTSLAFGNQPVGTPSAAETLSVSNSGSIPLVLGFATLTGTNAADFSITANDCSGVEVLPGNSCSVQVRFTPTVGGNRSATLTLYDNAGTSPQTVALTGSGATAAVTLAPTSLTFANQTVGTTSAGQTVGLTNSGAAVLTLSSIAASGDFAQTNNCGSSVAPGAGCTITVTFTPTKKGSRTGKLTVTDNAPNNPQTVNFSGQGK